MSALRVGGPRLRLITRMGWLATVLLVCGCASHQAYPQHWPTLARRGHTCTELSGGYRNRGQTAEGHLTWLSTLLFDGAEGVDSIRLVVQEDEQPVVRVEIPGGPPVVLAGETLSCRSGTLVVHDRGRWVAAGSEFGLFSVGRRSTSLELNAVADGLVIKVKRRTNTLVTAIPWTASDETWHRFERMASR
jgi:hypothetical protein